MVGILRVLLAIAVVVGHAENGRGENFSFLKMMNGGEAVQIFFVISGFYMSLILSKKYDEISLFYTNRFLRLYPAYALVLFATISWFLLDWAYIGHRPPPLWITKADAEMPVWQWATLQFSNFTMVGLDIPPLFHWKSGQGFLFLHFFYGDTAPDGAEWAGWIPWIRQAWSIGSEIWFYFLAPFVVRRHVGIQIGIASASLCLMIWMPYVELQPYYFFPANLWLFLLGSILYRFYQSKYFAVPSWSGYPALVYVLVTVCAVGAISNAAVRTTALMLVALCIPFLFGTFSRKEWDATIGNLSYPVYLVHMLILGVLAAVFHARPGIAGIAGVGLSLLAAAFITRFLDTPIDRYRQRRVQRRFDSPNETLAAVEANTLAVRV